MEYRTIDKDFDYQMEQIFKTMKQEALEEKEQFDSNYIWKNRERLGELVFEATEEQCGINELIEE
jgi:hypothetical protein